MENIRDCKIMLSWRRISNISMAMNMKKKKRKYQKRKVVNFYKHIIYIDKMRKEIRELNYYLHYYFWDWELILPSPI